MSGEIAEGIAEQPRSTMVLAAWAPVVLSLAVILAAVAPLYWSEIASAVRVWYSSTAYNHGFLILPIVLYLVWERRQVVAQMTPEPFYRVLPLIPAIGLAWLVADLIGLTEAQQLLLIAMLQVAILAIVGHRVYRALAFPLLYLFFAVPTGDFLVPAMQKFTAAFSVVALRVSGVPVFSDGFLISIPNASFYVAEACAGLRFLIATIAFGFLFAEFAYRSMARKIVFIAVCLVAPIIANGLRAYGIILLAYLTDGELAAGVDHVVYGWVFFSLVTVSLMAGGWVFRDHLGESPIVQAISPSRFSSAKIVLASLCALCMLALPPAYAAFLAREPGMPPSATLLAPAVALPWQAAPRQDDWQPLFRQADLAVRQGFSDGAGAADLYIAYYRTQSDTKKLITFENKLIDTSKWNVSDRATVNVEIGGKTVPMAVTHFVSSGMRRVVFSIYWVDGRFEPDVITAKLLQAKAALTGGPRATAVIALSTSAGQGWGAAEDALKDLAAHLGSIEAVLHTAGGG